MPACENRSRSTQKENLTKWNIFARLTLFKEIEQKKVQNAQKVYPKCVAKVLFGRKQGHPKRKTPRHSSLNFKSFYFK